MKKVLIVAPHPDDETLGCGGTLLRHKAEGDEIHWLIITKMEENERFSKDIIKKRDNQIEKVANYYGFNSVNRLGFSTMCVDEYSMSKLIKEISYVFNKVKPNIIYLPFKDDIHSDHRKIFEAAYSCTKIFRFPFIKKILMMEILSETDFSYNNFTPNVFVDISEFLEKKIEIMKIYEDEIGLHPFPRSEENIRAIATFRGAQAGCKWAEAFMLLKEIV